MRAIVIALLALVAVASAQSIYRTRSFSYTGGFSGCTNCGGADAQFSCSNLASWNRGIQKFYVDDVPNGFQLTEVSVTFTGTYNCLSQSAGSLINVTLNDQIVDAVTVTGSNQCKCGSCDGARTFVNKFYHTGFPNFRFFDYNVLRIDTVNGNDICLQSSAINMTFTKPSRQSVFTIAVSNSTGPSSSCDRAQSTAGLALGAYTVSTSSGCCWQYVTIPFQDPIGSKGRVIAINARLYTNFLSNNLNRNIDIRVNDQVIESRTVSTNSQACYASTGGIDFTTPSPFMFGWPSYSYGGVNTVQINLRGGNNYAYTFLVGQVVLELVYV